MKKQIGKIALVVAGISLVLWMLLIFTGGVFSSSGAGFSFFGMLVFFSWMVSAFTVIFCFAGDVIKFIGKMFASGYNSAPVNPFSTATKFCSKCGKQVDKSATFCPNCGEKLS